MAVPSHDTPRFVCHGAASCDDVGRRSVLAASTTAATYRKTRDARRLVVRRFQMPLDSPGERRDASAVSTESVVVIVSLIFLLVGGSGWWYMRHRDTASGVPPRTDVPPPPIVRTSGTRPAVRLCGSNTVGAELAPALVTEFLKSR